MDCLVPGRVLISPALDHFEDYPRRISEFLEMPFEIEYSIGDVIRGALGPERHVPWEKAFPYVGRIPEGEEQNASTRLAGSQYAKAACPDFTVSASSTVQPDIQNIDQAILAIGAPAQSLRCGDKCTVAILDTGIDGNILHHPQSLEPSQFDVTMPRQAGGPPHDNDNHGSLVAYIINKIAPGAKLLSIRSLRPSGTVSDILAGMYLAVERGPCDLINLSLRLNCDPGQCAHCKKFYASANAAQLEYFFSVFIGANPNCLLIAAAGNGQGVRPMAMPASFDGIVAVGESDMNAGAAAPTAQYQSVPQGRYLLAPGGDPGRMLGTKQSHRGLVSLQGTSFATAFVTGVAARIVCGLKGGACTGGTAPGTLLPSAILGRLGARAHAGWPAFNPAQHGLGIARY
ncbi:MAG TPA: S8/S53 family peptidase [Rhizomicrobium sp.]